MRGLLVSMGCTSILDFDSAKHHGASDDDPLRLHFRRHRLAGVEASKNRFDFTDHSPIVRYANFDTAEKRKYFYRRFMRRGDRCTMQVDVAAAQDGRRFPAPEVLRIDAMLRRAENRSCIEH